jgi:Protein kinase domain
MHFNRAQVDSLLIQLQNASAELRRQLQNGGDCRVEELFRRYPALQAEADLATRLIHTEWAVRVELGENPSVSAWLERFPQWRERLERRFREDSFFDASLLENTPTVDLGADDADDLNATRPATHVGGDFLLGEAPLPPLEIHQEIGRGAMGVVYLAWDKVLDRSVALKKIRPGLLDHPESIRRFYREARAAARLNHPHIIAIHGMGRIGEQHGFTMPLAKTNLDQQRDRFAAPPAATTLLAKIARAVHVAHRHGIIHRDLKPANILLDERDEPLVADFGLAVLLHQLESPLEGQHLAGTPHYMAPEQFGASGARIGPATDVWALGVILYELLSGTKPFQAKSMARLQAIVQTDDPASIVSRQRGVDRALEAIVRRCLAKNPDRRYASAEALAQDLENWRDGKPIQAKPDGWLKRTVRRVRRHPALATAAALLLAFGITCGLLFAFAPAPVPPPEDPDVVTLRSIHAQLRNGETVQFVTPQGTLLRHTWIHQSGGVDPNAKKEGVDVGTLRVPALLELLPEVPLNRYELRAELKILPGIFAQPGLYALHHAERERPVLAHSFLSLSFMEEGPQPGVFTALQYQDRINSASQIGMQRLPPTFGPRFFAALGPGLLARFKPKHEHWHTLTVQVTPEEVRWFHDQNAIYKVTNQNLADGAERIRLGRQLGPKLDRPPALVETAEPAFDHNGGVGLYLALGQATYRSITLKPLP